MAATAYLGVWRSGAGDQWWVTGVPEAAFKTEDAQHFDAGLRLVNFRHQQGAFTAVWQPGDGTQWVRWGLSAEDFVAQDSGFFDQGLRLRDFAIDDGRFSGVWRPGEGTQWVRWGLTVDAFTAVDLEFFRAGLRLVCLRVTNGTYAGVWQPGDGAQWWGYGLDYDAMVTKDAELNQQGLRLVDAEFHDGRFYALWRAGSGAEWWAYGDDFEKLVGRDTAHFDNGERVQRIFPYATSCRPECLNQVIMTADTYNYKITGTDLHLRGLPGSDPTPGPKPDVWYRWPSVDTSGARRVLRLSAVDFTEPAILTLPFDGSTTVNFTGGWLYDNGKWHHALDFSHGDGSTFDVRAAADGRVIFMGWDDWSGNTVIISHDAGGVPDAFRTISMHLRNGPNADTTNSWTRTMPTLGATEMAQFTTFLDGTGAPQNGVRDPDATFWGTEDDRLDFTLLGQRITRGRVIGKAGLTGPGGSGAMKAGWKQTDGPNTHLHFFVARRDPTDGDWYFLDPYGIYAKRDCYPPYGTDIGAFCARYPSLWLGNKASFPGRAFRRRVDPDDKILIRRRRFPPG